MEIEGDIYACTVWSGTEERIDRSDRASGQARKADLVGYESLRYRNYIERRGINSHRALSPFVTELVFTARAVIPRPR